MNDYLVRLGPPAGGDVIHRSTCRHVVDRPADRYPGGPSPALRWKWADRRGFENIDWDALRRHGIRPCQVCAANLLRSTDWNDAA